MALELYLKILFVLAFFAVLVSVGLVFQPPNDYDTDKTPTVATQTTTKLTEANSNKTVRLEATSLLALLTTTSRQQRSETLAELSKLVQFKFDQLSHWRRQRFSRFSCSTPLFTNLVSDDEQIPEVIPFPRRTPTNKQLRTTRGTRPNINFVRSQLLATCINKYWDTEPALQSTRVRWTHYPWLFGMLCDFHRQAYHIAQAQYYRKQSENERHWQSVWGDSADFCI